MNKAAIGNEQLAISQTGRRPCSKRDARAPVSLIANCLWPIAAFQVTTRVTSVTHRGLAGSVLIEVGEVYWEPGSEALETAKCKGVALPHCSFGEATCIQ